MFLKIAFRMLALAALLILGGQGEAVWAQEAGNQAGDQADAQQVAPQPVSESPLEANLLEERTQQGQAAPGDSQETRMMYFTRNLSAEVLVRFLQARSEFAAVKATPNRDTESVVLSGPEDKVREAVILIRRVDLVGRAITDPASAQLSPPIPDTVPAPQAPPRGDAEEDPRDGNPRFKTIAYRAQNNAAEQLADKIRDQAADGVLPGILAFVNKQTNSVVLTGSEPELGMALDYLKRVDTVGEEAQDVTDVAQGETPPAEVPQRGDQPQRGSRGREAFRQMTFARQAAASQQAASQQAIEPQGPQKMIQLDLLLLALPADQTKRQSDSIGELTGPIAEVLERIDALTAEGEAKILNQFSLNSIEGDAVMVQVGQRTPRITGVQTRATREAARPFPTMVQTQVENVGTLARLQTQITTDQKLLLNLQFEKSFAAPADSGVTLGADEEGGKIKASGIITMSLSQTVQIESGHASALVVSTSIDGEKSRSVRYVLVVGARR